MQRTVTMELAKETKGAIQYQEKGSDGKTVKGDEGLIGTLYLRKAAFDGVAFPHVIHVSVES